MLYVIKLDFEILNAIFFDMFAKNALTGCLVGNFGIANVIDSQIAKICHSTVT